MLTVTRAPLLAVVAEMTARCFAAAITLLVLGASSVNAVERQAVTTVRPLLLTAIDQGEAHGVLVGEAAGYVARTFGSTAPIEIDVKMIRSLPEPGCKRLAVTTSQDGVVDFNHEQREARPGRKAFTYQLNYCRDGRLLPASEGSQ